MKNAFILLFILLTLFNIMSYTRLPDKVAIHYGQDGKPDNWATKEANFYLMQGIATFFFLMFWFIPKWIFKFPPQWINLPNKDYWFSLENIELAKEKMNALMWEIGVYTLLFFGGLSALTYQTNMKADALNLTHFGIVFFGFLALTAYWCIKLFIVFKKPRM